MNPPNSKPNVVQAFQVVIYSRALHPDMFPLRGRKVVRHGSYELEAWVMPGQHLLRFEHKALCVTELIADQDRCVPTQGILSAFLCSGEKDYEHQFAQGAVRYMTTAQTENLSENLYHSTYEELLDLARQSRALAHRWADEAGKCLSLVDIQHMTREVHVQSYHLHAASGLVLRTQTIFEHQ
jgi:hypothetical protein